MKGRTKAVHPSPGRLYFSRVCPPWAGHRRGACQIANRLFHGVSLHSCTERKKVCLSFYRRDISDRLKHIRMWLNWRTHRRVASSTFPQAQRCDRKLARASAEKACNCSQIRSPGSSSHRISRCRGVHRQMARHRLPCGLLGIPFLAGMQRGDLHQFTPICEKSVAVARACRCHPALSACPRVAADRNWIGHLWCRGEPSLVKAIQSHERNRTASLLSVPSCPPCHGGLSLLVKRFARAAIRRAAISM